MTSPVNVDVKLGVNKFNIDEEHPHIVVKADAEQLPTVLRVCGATVGHRQHQRTGAGAGARGD